MNKKTLALGRLKSGVMNKVEAEYSRLLESMKTSGEVAWFAFEGITLKLAEGSRYTPDFLVMKSDGQLEVHEVKGRWIGDGKTKLRIAADKFPFKFKAIFAKLKRDGGGWTEEEF